jgi:hypothetical protein
MMRTRSATSYAADHFSGCETIPVSVADRRCAVEVRDPSPMTGRQGDSASGVVNATARAQRPHAGPQRAITQTFDQASACERDEVEDMEQRAGAHSFHGL